MKKTILSIILIVISLFTLSSCNNEREKDSQTIQLSITDNILSWSSYQGAEGYVIYIDNNMKDTVIGTTYALFLEEGIYNIKVSAKLSNGTYSSYSNTVTYTSNNLVQEKEKINAPTISIKDDIVSWNKIPNAKEYKIYCDDTLYETVALTFCKLSLTNGKHKIYVIAVPNDDTYLESNKSNEVTIEIKNVSFVLDTPVVTLNEGVISFNAVAHASSYNIYVDSVLVKNITTTTYTLDVNVGKHEIQVSAVSNDPNYANSKLSSKIIYEKVLSKVSGNFSVFQINDTHGAAKTSEDYAGLDKVESVIKSLEKTSGDVVKIANGDIFQGSYASNVTKGKIFIDTLNAMNFDCFVIGNHEFDWGLEEIANYKDGDLSNGELDFPFLSINIYDNNTGSRISWADPYTIVSANGIKVGIIGAIGKDLTSSISSDKVAGYTFLDPVPLIQECATNLRKTEGCDVVIVAIHEYESSTNNSLAALSGDARIDGIVCAHTHQYIDEKVKRNDGYQIPIIQSNTKNITVGATSYTLNNGTITSTVNTHYNPTNYNSDAQILKVLSAYDAIILEGEKVIGNTSTNLTKQDLGLLACNSMTKMLDADFGYMNTAGVRSTISSGQIKVKNIYDVFPFDNKLIKITFTGSQLKSFQQRASSLYVSSTFDGVIINNGIYTIIIIDYVYLQSYYNTSLSKGIVEYTNYYIRDAVIYGIQNGLL